MNNFNNKIKFIIGDKTLYKIPFELEKYNSSHAIVFIELKKEFNKIKKIINKTLKNTYLTTEFCCIEKNICKEAIKEFVYNYIKERKNKSIIAIGSTEFINIINTVRLMIVKNSDFYFNLRKESYYCIPMIAIPYKTIEIGFATANIIINNNIVDLYYIEDMIIISDRKLLHINFKKSTDKYFCALYKSLIATVNNTNIIAMPANKAVIQCILENILNLINNPHDKNAYIAMEEALLILNIGEELQKNNGLWHIINNLSKITKEKYRIFCEAAPKYLINYQENEVFNDLLKTLIYKNKINCANKNITIEFFNYVNNLRQSILKDKDVNKIKLKKEDVIKAYKDTEANNFSDSDTLKLAFNALIDICE